MDRRKKLLNAVLIAFAVETLSVTWLLKIPGWAPFFSILYFASGVSISVLWLLLPVVRLPLPGRKDLNRHTNHYRLIGIGLVALAMYSWCRYWFEEMPIDITNADMLPIIKVMGERFIAGQHSHVYDSIPWIWHGTQPIYLPAMWLPYVPAIWLGIDMRWITMAGLLFVFGVFLFLYRPAGHRYLSFFTGVLAFLLFWWIMADNTPGIVSVSEEGIVIAYYIFLVLALVSRNAFLTGIAISLCMLSRYALIGWVPVFVLYLLLEKKLRQLSILSITGLLCLLLLFLVPVGWSIFWRLAELPKNYIAFAGRVWHDSPDTFSTAPAFAWFFGPQRIALLHRVLVTLSFGVPWFFVLTSRWVAKKWEAAGDPRRIANIPLAGLKISLVVFYCFIDVPYLYLFYTSSFVSLIVITLLLREGESLPENGRADGPATDAAAPL